MGLTKVCLGELIELTTETNNRLIYGPEDVMGMTITKEIIPTKANVDTADLSKFLVVHPEDFVFNPRTHGTKIGFGYNESKRTFLISWNNIAFRVRECKRDVIVPKYLFLHFNRSEWDREACFRSWGSSTEVFSWDALCEMVISLPPIDIQQKYVNIYNAMLANQRCYESGLEDLKLTVDATIDQYKHTSPRIALRDLLIDVDVRNTNETATSVYGVTMSKKFVPSVANLDGVNLSRYKLVSPNQMACNFMHVGRDESLPIAINNTEGTIAVSPAYFVFDMKSDKCLAEYIMMWLSREESGRYCWYISDTSVRGGFSLECFYDIEIPVPDIQVQQYIADIYIVYQLRREINEQLKKQIKDICPILIKGSVEEAST